MIRAPKTIMQQPKQPMLNAKNDAPTEQDVIKMLQRNVPQIAQMLRQYFPPWSLFQAPGASLNETGNRSVALTDNAPLTDSTLVAMVGGVATWTFSKTFTKPPVCTATAVGPYPGGAAQEIFVSVNPTTQQVIFKSSANDDQRVLHITATQNP